MRFFTLKKSSRKSSARRAPSRRFRPTFDLLEDRRMLSATLWVDPSAPAGPTTFGTIQAAVNAAHGGDTIKVAAGFEYDESVVVNKTLTILGGQPHNRSQSGPSVVKSDSVAFTLDANGISLQQFTIERLTTEAVGIETDAGHAGYTILNNLIEAEVVALVLDTKTIGFVPQSTVSGNSFVADHEGISSDQGLKNVTIYNNSFQDNTDAAVYVAGSAQSTNVQILDNQIHFTGATLAPAPQMTAAVNEPFVIDLDDSLAAIVLANATCSEIDGNSITNPPEDGILLGGGVTYSEVAHNSLQINVGSVSNGIELNSLCVSSPDTDDTVSHNTVVGTVPGSGFAVGIILYGPGQNTVSGNTVQDSLADGIELADGSSWDTVSWNSSSGNLGNGIEVSNSSNNSVANNTASGNTLDGILLDGNSFYDSVSWNTATYNGSNGIEVSGSVLVSAGPRNPVNNTVSGNTTNYNTVDGIAVNGSNYVKISSNTSSHNDGDGIDLVNASWNTVSYNTANYNAVNGITLNQSGSTNNTVSGNTTNYNTGDGIALANGAGSNTISGNTGSHNGGNGIELSDADNNTVSFNTFLHNLGAGIFLHSDCSGNTLTSNTATGNGFDDLFDASTGGGTSGTANTWSHNTANNRSPAGLK